MRQQWRLPLAVGGSVLVHTLILLICAPLTPTPSTTVLQVSLEQGGAGHEGRPDGRRPLVRSAKSSTLAHPRSPLPLSVLTSTEHLATAPALTPAPLASPSSPPSSALSGEPSAAHSSEIGMGGSTAKKSLQSARFLGQASQPPYPENSRQLGEQGRVELKVLVGRDGQVKEVVLLRSSRFPRLDQAAEALLRQGPFAAAHRDGVAIESWLKIAVPFSLQ
jgi:protein TonB